MQTTQIVLHDEFELKNYLETAVAALAEQAGHRRGVDTPGVLVEAPEPPKPLPSSPTNAPKVSGLVRSSGSQKGLSETAELDAELVLQLASTTSLPIKGQFQGESFSVPATGSHEALVVTQNDFVSIPLVVDVWMTRCAANVPLFKYTQPKHFAGGFVVWSVLHHYFPRDAQLSAFHEPQTRLEFAEVWSQVDLILQKHNLTRLPVEVIAAVMAHRQAGQAILLMMLYEGLTNLKLPNPIPVLRDPCRRIEGGKCYRWNFLQETKCNNARRPASFAQLLRHMFTTNQEMAFCRSHRRLQPPRLNRHFESRVDFGGGREADISKLQRLVMRPQGDRCYLFHEDRANLIKKQREREKSHASSTPRQVLLQLPFFTTDPLAKCPRVPVA